MSQSTQDSSNPTNPAAATTSEKAHNTARSELRWQPLLDQWCVISAASGSRPWSGATAEIKPDTRPSHDPKCFLCPRVERASGTDNPDYKGAFAFDNDYASLSGPELLELSANDNPLQLSRPGSGACRVLCWSERHDRTLAELSADEMYAVAQLWQSEFATLSVRPEVALVLIFENKGVEIGVSNLHPHGQIYAMPFVSQNATTMRTTQAAYATANNGASLLQDLISRDEYRPPSKSSAQDDDDTLCVEQSQYFKTIVPYAARFAFETWIVPKEPVNSILNFNAEQLRDFAAAYQRQAKRYDILFQRSAPNITLLHNVPSDNNPDNKHWCFHLGFQPPLRDPQTLKYMAGYEAGSGNIVNPVQPINAARQLRACGVV